MPLLPRVPSPVRRLASLAGPHGDLWIKDDGELHSLYGGNKVRKLARILAHAAAHGSRRIVTLGAAGSHHVLTSALFAPQFGLRVAAVLAPQPRTSHAEAVLRSTLSAGVEVVPVSRWELAPVALLRLLQRGDYFVGPGGSGLLGTLAYADAVRELEEQVEQGIMPMPDVLVTAVGSGGTAAGLLAGVVERQLPIRVVGVQVTGGYATRALVLSLAARALMARGKSVRGLSRRFELTRSELGKGYGYETPSGVLAREAAQREGIHVEPTYTEKALAHALALARDGNQSPGRVMLYWHTLSAHTPPAADARELEPEFAALLRTLR